MFAASLQEFKRRLAQKPAEDIEVRNYAYYAARAHVAHAYLWDAADVIQTLGGDELAWPLPDVTSLLNLRVELNDDDCLWLSQYAGITFFVSRIMLLAYKAYLAKERGLPIHDRHVHLYDWILELHLEGTYLWMEHGIILNVNHVTITLDRKKFFVKRT